MSEPSEAELRAARAEGRAKARAEAEAGDGNGAEYGSDSSVDGRGSKPAGPVMMHSLVDAPTLSTANLASILEFEKSFIKYEREIKALCTQDVKATVKTLASCIEPRVLRSICKYELELGSNDWKTVSDSVLRAHLFGRRATLTQRERVEQARLLEKALVMNLGKGKSCEAAAIELFETLEEFLGEDEMDEVISTKKQCKLLIAALKPGEVKEGVEALLDDTQWVKAKTDVVLLRKLVLGEARLQDACWERRPKDRDRVKDKGQQQNNGATGKQCHLCGQKGHLKKNCTASTKGKPSPKPAPEKGDGQRGNKSSRKKKFCKTCGSAEHSTDVCTKAVKCFHCNQDGHLSYDCPDKGESKVKRVSGDTTNALLSGEVRTQRRNAVIGRSVEVPLCMDSGADNTTVSEGLYNALKKAGVVQQEKSGAGQLRRIADGKRVPLLKEIQVQLNIPTRAAVNGVTMTDTWMDVIGGDEKELLFGAREWKRLGLPQPEDYLDNISQNTVGAGVTAVQWVSAESDEDTDYSSDEESGTVPALRSTEERKLADREGVVNLLARAELEGASPEFMQIMKRCVQGGGVGEQCLSDELRPGEPARVESLDIEFVPGAKKPRLPAQRHYSPLQLAAMRDQIQELQSGDLVEPATGGELVAPVLMTRKKAIPVMGTDGVEVMEQRGYRMCVDFRPVNAITVKTPYPVPLIDHIIAQYLEGATVFGSGDALKGYWQFPITEKAGNAWAYMTPDGIFRPKRVPQGTANAVSHYQRIMTRIFREAGLLHKGVLVFVDDILVYAKTEVELAELWVRVFAALAKHNIYLCTKKTHLLKREIVWCGKLISGAGRGVDPRRVAAIDAVPRPTNGGQLLSFLASTNWIRDHIPNYAAVIAPLQDLLKDITGGLKRKTKRQAESVPLAPLWKEQHTVAWDQLKLAVAASVTLTSPSEEKDFCLFTDASDSNWGAILTQVPRGFVESSAPPEDWPHEPLSFISGGFRGAQLAWPIVGKEAFAVHEACNRLEHFIQRERGVHIFTDHRNLVYIFEPAGRPLGTSKGTAGRLERWAIALSAVPYTIQHVEGESNGFADMLSRWGATMPAGTVRRVMIALPSAVRAEGQAARVQRVRVQLRPGATAAEFVEDDPDDEDSNAAELLINPGWPTDAAIRLLQQEVAVDEPRYEVGGEVLTRGATGLLQTSTGKVWVPQRQQEPAEVDDATALRLRIMVIAHAGMGGHRGYGATLRAVTGTFWWPDIVGDVRAFCNDCLQCVKNAQGHVVPRPMGEVIQPTGPNQLLHFDYLYLGSSGGMLYLLVIKDGFSGVCELVPCAAPDSESAGQALVEWFSRYGQPRVWVSDQGPHFKNECIEAVTRAFKVAHHFTCPEAAWSNGTVERLNREVLRLFRVLLSENKMGKEQWIWLRPAVQAVINHTPTERLGRRSPMEVHTGQRSPQPLDGVVLLPRHKKPPTVRHMAWPEELDEYMRELQSALDEWHTTTTKQQQARHSANKRHRDGDVEATVRRRPLVKHGGFDVGDYVLVARDTNDKLAVRWLGPMRVVEVVNDWVYVVEDLVHQHRYTRHAQMLRKYNDSQLAVTEQLREQLANDDATFLHVDKFVAWKKQGQEVFLQVRWRGFTAASDTWVNFADLAVDVPDRVRSYVEQHKTDRNGQALVLKARAAKLYA